MARAAEIQKMLQDHLAATSKMMDDRTSGLSATVALQGQSFKEMSIRFDQIKEAQKATHARMDALGNAHQVAMSRSPLSHAVQSGKRRAVDGGPIGDSSTSAGGGGG
eukprot:5803686-Pyramimonas_sp.AAC.1